MAFHVPAQTRAVDPYSSYNSDNVNALTRVISKGLDVISSGLNVDIINGTSVNVTDGVAIKDDTMINITEDNIVIDMNDAEWFVEATAMIETTAKYYVVMDYIYAKTTPAPKATIRILKNRSNFTDRYMFIKCIDIVGGVVSALYDYDPDNPEIGRRGAAIQMTIVDNFPGWTEDQIGQFYILTDGSMVAIGGPTGWVYIPTQPLGTTYSTVRVLGSVPVFVNGQDEGQMIIVGQVVYIGGDTAWVDVSAHANSVCATIDGIANTGGNIDFVAGAGISISSNDTANTITFTPDDTRKIFLFDAENAEIIEGLVVFEFETDYYTINPFIVQVYSSTTQEQILPSLIKIVSETEIRVGFNVNPGDITILLIHMIGATVVPAPVPEPE